MCQKKLSSHLWPLRTLSTEDEHDIERLLATGRLGRGNDITQIAVGRNESIRPTT